MSLLEFVALVVAIQVVGQLVFLALACLCGTWFVRAFVRALDAHLLDEKQPGRRPPS